MTGANARLAVAVAAAAAAIATSTAHAQSPKRRVAVLEYRAGSEAVPGIAKRAAEILRKKTSLTIIDIDDARVAKGARVDQAIAKCSGQARCVAGIGRALAVDEVLLIGVSEFGDVILTLQRVDVANARVISRIAEALAPDAAPDAEALNGYLRGVMPRSDFVRWGTLVIAANVDGARVKVDDKVRGKTPLAPLKVRAPADYDIAVDKSGYIGFRATVNVPPDATVQVRPMLSRSSNAWYKKWWVAALAGTVVVSAATIVVVSSGDDPTDFPLDINPF